LKKFRFLYVAVNEYLKADICSQLEGFLKYSFKSGGIMKSKLYTLILVVTGILVFSCRTATKLYNKGNYDEAVSLASKKLQKHPDDPEMQELIRAAYRNAVSVHEANIRTHSNSTNDMRWEWIYNEYAALQRLFDVTKGNILISKIVRPADYSSYLETYRGKAVDIRIERGENWLLQHDRQAYKNAYHEFQVADRLKPGDISIKNKMNEAYEMAVVNVLILSNNDYGFGYSSYNTNNYNNRNFGEEVLRDLKYHTGNEFVRFYSEWEAQSQRINPDQFIDMRFTHFNTGRVRDDNSSRDVSKRIVVKETVYRPDSIVYEYANVSARITTTKRIMNSEGLLQINIRDNDGRWLWSDNFRGDHHWSTEFASYTGDARALSETDKQLVNRRPENPPYEDEIIRHLMNEIDNNIPGRIRDFYRRF
jgi:hypothetical protein